MITAVSGDAPETATHLRSVVGAPRAGCRYTHDSDCETVVDPPVALLAAPTAVGRTNLRRDGPVRRRDPEPISGTTRRRGGEPRYADIAKQLGIAHRKIESAVMSGRRFRRTSLEAPGGR